MSHLRRIALAVATLAAASAHATPPLAHELFSLDSNSYHSTYAVDFCGNGQIAGTALTTGWANVGFITNKHGETSTYSVPGSTYTEVMGCYKSRLMGTAVVNGARAGFYQDADGTAHLVAPEGGTYPTVEGMNAAGTVVGWYMPQDKDNVRASSFIIQDGVFTRFDLESWPDTRLNGILDDGTMYGTYMSNKPLRASGFILRDGALTVIDIPGSYDTVITGVNKAGRVIGYYQDAIGEPYKGFAWENGKHTKFSFSAEGGSTYPKSIDAKGNVVGYISNPDYTQASFVARPRPKAAD